MQGLEITADDIRIDRLGFRLFSEQATEFRNLGEIFARPVFYVDGDGCRSTKIGCFESPTTLEDLVHAGLENPSGRSLGLALTQKKVVQPQGILRGNGKRCLSNPTADLRGGEAQRWTDRHVLVALHFPGTRRINSGRAVDAIFCGLHNIGAHFHRLNDFSLQKNVILCDSAL